MRKSRFDAKLELWKTNLLDLSHRNKKINFKPNATKSLEILHPSSNNLFNNLITKNNKHFFCSVFKPKEDLIENDEEEDYIKIEDIKDDKNSKNLHLEKKELEDKKHLDFERLHKIAIEKKKKNAKITDIISNHDDIKLEKILKGLLRKARTAIEEKGVNVLYITFGLLKWKDITKQNKTSYSPILFIPLILERETILSNFKISIMDDDIILNRALSEKFKNQFAVTFPEFPENFEENSLNSYFKSLKKIFSGDNDWEFQDRIFIDVFSFSKITLFSDLNKNIELLKSNPIIKALAEGIPLKNNQDYYPDEEELGDNVEPKASYTVLDCDSSQFESIQYAKKGASIVIRGPPGTGKSQTISNIIAECLSENKKVLFVAQKKAALDVVKNRLDASGIGNYCLEIHSNKSNKFVILNNIKKRLNNSIVKQSLNYSKYDNLKNIRKRLNNYIELINLPIGETDSSIFQMIGEFQKYSDIISIKTNMKNALNLTENVLFEIKDQLSYLENYKEILTKYDANPWKKSGIKQYKEEMKENLESILDNLLELVEKVEGKIDDICDKYDILPIKKHRTLVQINDFFQKFNYYALEIDSSKIQRVFSEKYSNLLKYLKKSYYLDKKIVNNCLKNRNSANIEEDLNEIISFHEKYSNKTQKVSYKGIEYDINALYGLCNDIIHNSHGYTSMMKSIKIPKNSVLTEWEEKKEIINYWLSKMDSFDEWCSTQLIYQRLQDYGVGSFFNKIKNQNLNNTPFEDIFYKSYLWSWINEAFKIYPEIKEFNSNYHLKNIELFRNLDENCIDMNKYRLCKFIESNYNPNTQELFNTSEYGFLMRELQKKRRIKPLREILVKTKNFTTNILPCFLMSPLSVSNYLPANEFANFFDIVIFDEASQICPEDSIGAILRGKQLIVVGDENQLPPTSFFSSNQNEFNDSNDDDNEILESILNECLTIGLKQVMLKWHYRSRKEDLITFSNHHIYDNNLITFPDLLKEKTNISQNIDELTAIEFNYVENGVYDKGKSRKNINEAKQIVSAIIEHFRNNAENNRSFSLGIVTFSQAQLNAISDELDKEFRKNPELESIINNPIYNSEPFFIKNLENIQGDERDFIFFSIGYGKDINGIMSLNFGPINKSGGERRLNVAITRARYHIKIFASFLPSEIDYSKSGSRGLKLLIQYLKYAKNRNIIDHTERLSENSQLFESPFEEDVCAALESIGYTVDTQIGSSGYRIDLAIVDPMNPSNYLLGIECDGASYHSSKFARDRDRIRHNILENLGWKIYHIWSTDWFNNKNEVLKEIKTKIENLIEQKKLKRARKRKTNIINNTKIENNIDNKINFVENKDNMNKTNIVDKRDPKIRKLILNSDKVIRYKSFNYSNVRTPESFYQGGYRLRNAINDIIETEGPIHNDLLKKRVLDYYGFKRTGQKIERIFEYQLGKKKFFFPTDYNKSIFRIGVEKGEDPRKFNQIPDFEIINCIKFCLNQAFSLESEDLYRSVGQIFGSRSINQEINSIMEKTINSLIKSNQILEKNGRYELVK